jgi:hypothetical protein
MGIQRSITAYLSKRKESKSVQFVMVTLIPRLLQPFDGADMAQISTTDAFFQIDLTVPSFT